MIVFTTTWQVLKRKVSMYVCTYVHETMCGIICLNFTLQDPRPRVTELHKRKVQCQKCILQTKMANVSGFYTFLKLSFRSKMKIYMYNKNWVTLSSCIPTVIGKKLRWVAEDENVLFSMWVPIKL
jgi:hypothetical protein